MTENPPWKSQLPTDCGYISLGIIAVYPHIDGKYDVRVNINDEKQHAYTIKSAAIPEIGDLLIICLRPGTRDNHRYVIKKNV